MAADTEQLVVELEARIHDFEKNFEKANRTASDNWSKIEARGRLAGNRLQADMAKAAGSIANSIGGIGLGVLGNLGISTLGLSGMFAMAVKVNGELAKLEGMAKRAGISTDRLQEDKFAANVKGLSDDDFQASITTSLGLLDEAKRQVNSLQRLFNANGLSIKDSNGALLNFDQLLERAAGLMVRTKSEQEKIKIAEMLGLSRDWIRVLENGPEAFRKLAAEAGGAGAVIDKETIAKAKQFDRAWTEAVIRFKAGMTEALTDLARGFGEFWHNLIDGVPGGNFLADLLERWAGGLKALTLPELQNLIKRGIEQGVDQVEIDRLQAEIDRRLGKAPLKVTVRPEIEPGSETIIPKEADQKNPFNRAVFETNKRIAALDAETATIGLNSEARERAKTVAQLEEAAKKANTEAGFQNATVTDEQRRKINALADAMLESARKQRVAQTQFESFNETLRFSGGLAVDFLDALGDKTKKFADVFQAAMASVKRAAINALILGEGPLAGILGLKSTVGGGTGGLLGMLFGGFTGAAGGGTVSGAEWLAAGKGLGPLAARAGGGIIRGPGTGTSDSILARVSHGEYVVRAAETAKNLPLLEAINAGTFPRFADGGLVGAAGIRLPGGASGGISEPVHQTNHFNVNVAGSAGTPAHNQDLSDRMVRGMQDMAASMVAKGIRQQMRQGGMLGR